MTGDRPRSGFRIRTATRADTGAVDALLQRSYPRLLKADYPPSVLVLALPGMTRARPSLMTCGTYYVAEAEDGALLGAGGWTAQKANPARGDIRHFVTDPDHLRQGVARAIMAHGLATAAAHGVRALDCWATRTAVPFYQSAGFVTQGPIDVTLGNGAIFPAVQMHRAL